MYCDGGMCNDFPVDALPQEATRMGLMVRPIDWIRHHLPGMLVVLPCKLFLLCQQEMSVILLASLDIPS